MKKKNKAVPICRWHDLLITYQEIYKKIFFLELISEFSNIVRYNISIQKSILFQHTTNESMATEIKILIPFLIAPPCLRNEIVRCKSKKTCREFAWLKLQHAEEEK